MKVIVMKIVIDAFGIVPKGFEERMEDLEIRGRIDAIQTTALKLATVLERVLDIRRDLLSLRLHWKTTSKRWHEKIVRSKIKQREKRSKSLLLQINKIPRVICFYVRFKE